MSNSSAEFEKWYPSIGGYGDAHKKDLWECWKASRAALCVDLPKYVLARELDSSAHVLEVIDVIAELNKHGVSYK